MLELAEIGRQIWECNSPVTHQCGPPRGLAWPSRSSGLQSPGNDPSSYNLCSLFSNCLQMEQIWSLHLENSIYSAVTVLIRQVRLKFAGSELSSPAFFNSCSACAPLISSRKLSVCGDWWVTSWRVQWWLARLHDLSNDRGTIVRVVIGTGQHAGQQLLDLLNTQVGLHHPYLT